MGAQQILFPTEFRNPEGLGIRHIEAITDYLRLLRDVDPDVAEAVARYVIDGDDETVLLTLRGMKDAADALRLQHGATTQWGLVNDGHRERARIWRPGGGGSPAV